ncbi:hypothetical protein LCGC14_1497500, partial [marine sediment metagenome]
MKKRYFVTRSEKYFSIMLWYFGLSVGISLTWANG